MDLIMTVTTVFLRIFAGREQQESLHRYYRSREE